MTQENLTIEPLIDTVHFAVPMKSVWLDKFFSFDGNFFAGYNFIARNDNGRVVIKKELSHAKHLHSWWSSMVFLRKTVPHFGDCLFINYSYHKWHMITNALNAELDCSFNELWKPIAEALGSFKNFHVGRLVIDYMRSKCILRRVDWSINMTVYNGEVADILRTMYRFKVQYQDCPKNFGGGSSGSFQTLMWGTPNSAFQIKVYNKTEEVKKHLTGKDATLKEKEFYINNRDKLQNILRFEIGYSSKFFISDKVCELRGLKKVWKQGLKMKGSDKTQKILSYEDKERQVQGEEQINKVLIISKTHMLDKQANIFRQFETQGMNQDDQLAFAMVQEAIENSELSNQLKAVLCQMVSKFWINSYKKAKSYYSENTFYRNKKILLEKFNWDIRVKSCLNTEVLSTLAAGIKKVKVEIKPSIILY